MSTTTSTDATDATDSPAIRVHIIHNDLGMPAGKLADAEVHFLAGPLAGLRLVGFAVWQRRSGTGRNVTFPARTYSVNGERRSFSLLRPQGTDDHAESRVRDLVLQAYADFEEASKAPKGPQTPEERYQEDVLARRTTQARDTGRKASSPQQQALDCL